MLGLPSNLSRPLPAWRRPAGSHLVAALVLIALLLLLRGPSLGDPLGIDEGGMTVIGTEWVQDVINGRAGESLYGDHWVDRPPVILGLYGAAQLLGGELGIRVLGLLAALASALLAGVIAERLAGRRAWIPAAFVTACLLSSPALDGDRTAGELLAAVPAAAALALLVGVAAHDASTRLALSRRYRFALLAGAGGAIACAPLVKQSALDAGVAALAWLTWRLWADRRLDGGRRRLARDLGALTVGGLTVAGIALVSALRAGASLDELAYALVGFRVDVLSALQTQTVPPLERVTRLLDPAAISGLLAIGALAPIGIYLARQGRAGMSGLVLLAGWLVGALVGVSGGGYFWAHYLLQLAVPAGVAVGVLLARRSLRPTIGIVAALAAIAVAGQVVRADPTPPQRLLDAGYTPTSQQSVLAISDFIKRNSSPNEEIAVLYARANIAYHAERPQATPYAWSSMYRALPEARAEMLNALQGPERSPWVVMWHKPGNFGLDADGSMQAALDVGYRSVARLCGKRVLVRSDRATPSIVLPAERCPTAGPEQVYGDQPVIRGFARR
ncbi:MAG: hypothetical protein JWO69_1674 [Thermoleophilia bacterium]|jgi:hypothetical protein|nr:hypothetical protein [Thermoleophilia bacterium]